MLGLSSKNSELVITNDCTCLGCNQIYECQVLGEGATFWKGTAFDCLVTNNEIILFHSINSTSQRECNNGAVTGRLIHADNNFYYMTTILRAI